MDEQLKSFVGKRLGRYTLEECTEIFQVDKDGLKVESHGCLKDETLAKAFVEVRGDPQYWHPADREYLRTGKVLVLNDGIRAFRFGSGQEVKLLPESQIRISLQQQAREKISPAIRSLLAV